MKRSKTVTKVNPAELTVDRSVNFRDDYDTESLTDQILVAKRILEPIHIREDKVVLRGNRRVLTAQKLLANPNLDPEIRKALENTEAFIYSDLTDREQTEFVLDHGGQKPLSRVETCKAVRRLLKQMMSERDIASLMYQQLARFTGNAQKAYQASQIPAGSVRDDFVKKWLHGTLGNYIIPASGMGEYVWDQFLLTELENDRALSAEEKGKRKMDVNREAIKKLNSAKATDKEEGKWDSMKNTGPSFEAAIADLEKAYGKPKAAVTRVSPEQMKTAAENMQSGLRLAFLQCAGDLKGEQKSQLDTLDTEYARRDKVFPVLVAQLERIANTEVKALVNAILNKSDVDVFTALLPFLPESTTIPTDGNGQPS